MKVSFRCQNCKKELRDISIGEDGTILCPFCKTENKLKKVDIICPNCKNTTESWIPEGTQVWGVHYADLIPSSVREAMGKKSSEFQNDVDRDVFLTASFKDGGEVESKCSNCETYIHTYFKKGERVGDYRHMVEIIGEYIPKKLGKPRHLFGLIPDKNFQDITPAFFIFLLGFLFDGITSGFAFLFKTPILQPVGNILGFIIYGVFFTFSYYFLLKIKDLASDAETKLSEDKKRLFYKTFSIIFKPSWALFYCFFVFIILSIDNFGPEIKIRWLTDIAGIPIYFLGGIMMQIFFGYGLLLYTLGGGPQFEQPFKENFFAVRSILRRASSINYQISFTVSIMSILSVLNMYYFSTQEAIELYTIKGLLLLWAPLIMLIVILSFIGYSLLLQNITNKVKEDTLQDIDEKISNILKGKEDISRKKDLVQSYFSIKNYLEGNRIGVISYETAFQGTTIIFASSIPYLLKIIKLI